MSKRFRSVSSSAFMPWLAENVSALPTIDKQTSPQSPFRILLAMHMDCLNQSNSALPVGVHQVELP
jgi:hypothetical protein